MTKGWRSVPDSERRKWQDPDAVLAEIGVKAGLTFVDVGCGDGYFALPAARLVGGAGRVYGVDVDAGAIDRLAEKAAAEGLTNLTLKAGKAEDTVLCASCADIVFFGIDLHDFQDPRKALSNARVMLKPVGRLIDLDWKKMRQDFGPPYDVRFTEQEASRLIESAGFKVDSVKNAGPYHYLIVARLQAV